MGDDTQTSGQVSGQTSGSQTSGDTQTSGQNSGQNSGSGSTGTGGTTGGNTGTGGTTGGNTGNGGTTGGGGGGTAPDGSILPSFAGAGVATTSFDTGTGLTTGYGRIIVYWLDQYGVYEINQWCIRNAGEPAPSNATYIIPPTIPAAKIAVFTPSGVQGLGSWQLMSDNRGTTVYSTTDGSAVIWQKPGDIPAGYTTTPRPSPTAVWDATAGQWITSQQSLKDAAKTALTNAQANIALAEQQGLTVGPKYTAYEKALAAIAWGEDTTSTSLPVQPDSPTE